MIYFTCHVVYVLCTARADRIIILESIDKYIRGVAQS